MRSTQITGPGIFNIDTRLAEAQAEANRTRKPVVFMVNKMEITVKPETSSKTATPGSHS